METATIREFMIASAAAGQAGHAIMKYFNRVTATEKADGTIVTEADHAANEIIVNMIRAAFPDAAILSEEMTDSDARLANSHVWIIDPIDGTSKFFEGSSEFAVHVGLAINGYPSLGAVYLPVQDIMYIGGVGAGAWKMTRLGGDVRWKITDMKITNPTDQIRMAVSHKWQRHPFIVDLANDYQMEVIPSGSLGVKMMMIADNEADLYVNQTDRVNEWDTCAPDAILRALGGVVTDCTGKRLQYNKEDVKQRRGVIAALDLSDIRQDIHRRYSQI